MNFNLIEQLPNHNKDWFVDLRNLYNDTLEIFESLSENSTLFKYESNKWTLKELLDHITECEKIFNYRALRFCKSDKVELPGFDENLFVTNGNANHQALMLLIEEFKLTRLTTLCFFGKLTQDELDCMGSANSQHYSVYFIAKHIAEHNRHHLKIIKERYLPFLN